MCCKEVFIIVLIIEFSNYMIKPLDAIELMIISC